MLVSNLHDVPILTTKRPSMELRLELGAYGFRPTSSSSEELLMVIIKHKRDDLRPETTLGREVGDTGRFGPAIASALGTCTLISLRKKSIPWTDGYSASPEGPVSEFLPRSQSFHPFAAEIRSLFQTKQISEF